MSRRPTAGLNPSFPYPASYAGIPTRYCRLAEGSAAKTVEWGEGR